MKKPLKTEIDDLYTVILQLETLEDAEILP